VAFLLFFFRGWHLETVPGTNAKTVSLFKDGQRCSPPQPLPESLANQAETGRNWQKRKNEQTGNGREMT